jgi:opine dehydrogenase
VTSVAVLGAGAGGAAATVQLVGNGHDVFLWSRSEATIAPFRDAGSVSFDGELGTGAVEPSLVTCDLDAALGGADVALVCLPGIAHEPLAHDLAARRVDIPIVLDPGGTGGALVFLNAFRVAGSETPPIAELSTLTYIARKPEPAAVSIFAVARNVYAACLPGGDKAMAAAQSLLAGIRREPNVLSTSLRNINLVLHPPVSLLSVAWVEATEGDFLVYSEAMTPGVFRLMQALDDERRALGAALGLDLPGVVSEMMALGSVDEDAYDRGRLREVIARGTANASIAAPTSLSHRYYTEDLPYGVVPFSEMARTWRVPTPTADAIITLASAVLGADLRSGGLNAGRLGIEGMGPADVLELVEGRR